jgi:predicted small lipoprotein YifL
VIHPQLTGLLLLVLLLLLLLLMPMYALCGQQGPIPDAAEHISQNSQVKA